VVSTLILIWFTGPISRIAQRIVPSRPMETKPAGVPVYLDESSLTVPSLGLERICLELRRLGEHVLGVVRHGSVAVIEGSMEDINLLLEQDRDSDQLASAILHYIGQLSEVEHSSNEGQQMVGLAQVTTNLEGVSGIIATNLVSVGQQRLSQSIDLTRLRDESTRRFADAVLSNLELAITTIGHPSGEAASQVSAAKADIDVLAAAARQSVLNRLQLADMADVQNFRLATDLIEQFRQIAQLSRAIAKRSEDFN